MGQATFETSSLSFKAGAAVTAGYVVKQDSTEGQVIHSAGATDANIVGVALHGAASGSSVDVFCAPGGVVECIAAAAISLGALVQSNGDGKVKTNVSTGHPLGLALEASTADADRIRVLWSPSTTVKA